jgi:protein-tyrosine phosphatase
MPRNASPSDPIGVLFVCLGNICRSPLAEGVFLHLVRERGLEDAYRIDSAGTGGWHAGEPPDSRSAAVASRHGVELRGTARQIATQDFSSFDLIVAMDQENLRNLESLHPGAEGRARLALLREYDPEAGTDLVVPDPYYGGKSGFDQVFRMVWRSCQILLDRLEEERGG